MKQSIHFRLFILVALAATCSSASAPDEKPTAINFFNGTYQQALDEAKKEGKLVFIDAYTNWCSPCHLLSNYVFTDRTVGKYFNEHYINVKLDIEKGEGPALAKKYNVTHFPMLIIADGEGNRMAFTVGYIMAIDLIDFGKYGIQMASDTADCAEGK
jgi:thioredoxin-related protein